MQIKRLLWVGLVVTAGTTLLMDTWTRRSDLLRQERDPAEAVYAVGAGSAHDALITHQHLERVPDTKLLIRPFIAADQPAACSLILDGLGGHFGCIDASSTLDLDAIMARYIPPGQTFMVAEVAEKIVGTRALISEGAHRTYWAYVSGAQRAAQRYWPGIDRAPDRSERVSVDVSGWCWRPISPGMMRWVSTTTAASRKSIERRAWHIWHRI